MPIDSFEQFLYTTPEIEGIVQGDYLVLLETNFRRPYEVYQARRIVETALNQTGNHPYSEPAPVAFQDLWSAISRVREWDSGLTTFGSETHRYEFLPPCREEEIVDYERKMGIQLPEEYRWFVRNIGEGGAGPGYGLKKLRDMAPDKVTIFADEFTGVIDRGGFHLSLRQTGSRPIVDLQILKLCHWGCEYWNSIVVRGIASGFILFVDEEFTSGRHLLANSFGKWYRNWLDAAMINTYSWLDRVE